MLVAVVQTLDLKGDDPTCQLMDESGTIAGMIHGDVMSEHGSRIQPGSVIVLSNVAVLIGSLRKHYVNITRKNVASLYWNKTSSETGQTSVHSRVAFGLTDEDVMANFAQINREEAQALKRAKELERQAVAAAEASAAAASPSVPPRMHTPQPPPFRAPSFKSPPTSQAVMQPRVSNPQLQATNKPPPVINPQPSANVIQSNTATASTSSVTSGGESSDLLLDGLDEESLFGDF